MLVIAKVKQAGKLRDPLIPREYILEKSPETLKDLLEELVTINVEEFNRKPTEQTLFAYLTGERLDEMAESGKVSFGSKWNDKKQDLKKAIDNALLSFEDGIYRVFIDEVEMENLKQRVELQEGSEIVFIKLVLLAGRLY